MGGQKHNILVRRAIGKTDLVQEHVLKELIEITGGLQRSAKFLADIAPRYKRHMIGYYFKNVGRSELQKLNELLSSHGKRRITTPEFKAYFNRMIMNAAKNPKK